MRVNKKKRVIMERLVPIQGHDRTFDLDFWKRVGPQGKFEAAWEMVCDLAQWNSRYATQSRLRRTVESLQRRPN